MVAAAERGSARRWHAIALAITDITFGRGFIAAGATNAARRGLFGGAAGDQSALIGDVATTEFLLHKPWGSVS